MGTSKTYLTGLILLLFYSGQAQTTWVADNNVGAPTGPNVFTTLQAAVNAAAAGDIVQVQPSPITYGSVSINKQLTFMGIGFALDKDIPLLSRVSDIYLRNNTDNSSDASGTIIKGLIANYIHLAYKGTAPFFTIQNILIQNCQINYLYNWTSTTYGYIDGLEVRDCYIVQTVTTYRHTDNAIFRNNLIIGDMVFYAATTGNNIISNNILYGGIYHASVTSPISILHNNFIGQKGTETAFVTKLESSIISNNIFYGSTPSIATGGTTSAEFEANSFSNNLVYETGDDTMPPTGGLGNTGTGNIVATPSFVNVQLLNTWSSAYDFTLDTGSLALLAGSDGTDIGISGGTSYPWTETNFNLKTTDAPTIQIFNTSTVINPGDDLPIRVQIKSN